MWHPSSGNPTRVLMWWPWLDKNNFENNLCFSTSLSKGHNESTACWRFPKRDAKEQSRKRLLGQSRQDHPRLAGFWQACYTARGVSGASWVNFNIFQTTISSGTFDTSESQFGHWPSPASHWNYSMSSKRAFVSSACHSHQAQKVAFSRIRNHCSNSLLLPTA